MDNVSTGEIFTQTAQTVPTSFPLKASGFASEKEAMEFGQLAGAYVGEISRTIDLSQLDGITIAYDYSQALLSLDRGYQTSQPLTPSEGATVGIAMTPSVIRDGQIKSHIVLNALYVRPLENSDDQHYRAAFHTVAHECAHVEITHQFDKAFPNVLLQRSYRDMQENFRWQTILACWDEYAATLISAKYGDPPTVGYEDTFLGAVTATGDNVNQLFKEFRIHDDVTRILQEVYEAMGNLLKFAAYHLGNLRGLGVAWTDMPRTVAALEGHWFTSFFLRLQDACSAILANYAQWEDESAFETIGNLVDELVAMAGLHITKTANGGLHVEIP